MRRKALTCFFNANLWQEVADGFGACQHIRAQLPGLEGSTIGKHATRKDSSAPNVLS